MAEREGAALGKAISNQSITIEILHTELEEERKASASAVEEALSMILRLQEEKALVMMEACQYKRLAEEKMHHAEESLAILEEAVYNKEVEIASLKYQIQAYKHKLLSTTFNKRDVEEMNMFDYPTFRRSSSFLGKRSFLGLVRRNMSMPAARLDQLCSEIDIIDEDGCLLPREQSILRTDKCTAQLREEYEESKSQNFTREHVTEKYFCHWESAEKLDTSMRELWQSGNITDEVKSGPILTNNELQKFVVKEDHVGVGECKSYSRYSEYDSTLGGIGTKLNGSYVSPQTEDPENMEYNSLESSFPKNEVNGNTAHSVSVQETKVPRSDNCFLLSESYEHVLQEPLPGANDVTGMLRSMPQETTSKAVIHTHGGNILSSSREAASENYCLSDVDPDIVIATSRAEVKQLKKWMKRLVNDIRIVRQGHSNVGKLQSSLLRDIHDQLIEIQSDIKNSNSKKCPQQDDSALVLLTEANRHTIILMQASPNRATRTFMVYGSTSQAMDGLCRLYERKLKELNPAVQNLTYDITDLYNFIDGLADLSAILVYDHSIQAYLPNDRQWIKQSIFQHLKKLASR